MAARGFGYVDIRIAADYPRRAGLLIMLRHIKHRHSNIKGMCYQENGNKGFEKPPEKHKSVNVVHIVFSVTMLISS